MPLLSDVLVHWIGGTNDTLFNTIVTGAQVTSVVDSDIGRLYRAGARNLILANYNDIMRFLAIYSSPDYNIPSVRAYNDDLNKELKSVASGYAPYARTGLVDVGALFHNITERPLAFYFNEDYLHPPAACLTGVYSSEGVPRNLCSDPESHVFYDVYYPGKEVHALIEKFFITSITGLAG